MKMEDIIRQKLEGALSPSHLIVENQSHLHAGHAGDDGSGASHFAVEIWSDDFSELSRVARERLVHDVLKDEIPLIHALSIKIASPSA